MTSMNPLTALPPRVRLYAYAIFSVAALGVGAYRASDGDWVEFAALLLGSLGFGTAASNVNSPPDGAEDDEPDDDLSYEEAGGQPYEEDDELPFEGGRHRADPVSGN